MSLHKKIQPRFPGQMKARASYREDGTPNLEIELEEMTRLQEILQAKIGRDPTMKELFDYVWKEQQQ